MSDTADDHDIDERPKKRIRQACLNCRRKKVRCTGEKPICSFCHRLSQDCHYAGDAFDSYTRTDLNALSELPTVLSALESRFSALESRLASLESMLDRTTSLMTTAMATSSSIMRPQVLPLQLPSVNADEAPSDTQKHITTILGPGQGDRTAAQRKPTLPPKHILIFAADIYFRFCYNQPYSLFHEGRFRQRLSTGQVPAYLVWAFLASARRYSTFPHYEFEGGDSVSALAKNAWDVFDVPWAGPADGEEALAILQTTVLLVNVEHPAGHCSSAFLKLGFATRVGQLFRFHMEPDPSLDPISQEERRRAFWGIHLQDRLMSLSRERTPILRDEDCTVHLPCSDEAFHKNQYEDAPSLAFLLGDSADEDHVEKCTPLALIPIMVSGLNKVSQYVLHERKYRLSPSPWLSNSPFAAIESFLHSIEMHFGFGEPVEEMLEREAVKNGVLDQFTASPILYARALYSLSQCLLHHPFLLKYRLHKLRQRVPSRFIARAWETCRLHAKLITSLRRVRERNVLLLTSFYGYCTMMAGTIHALSQHDPDNTVREEACKNYEADLEFMRDLSAYWPHAALIASRLEKFKRQSAEYYRQIMDTNSQDPDQSNGSAHAIWQTVDHWALSMPTRPSSPSEEPSVTQSSINTISPDAIFDFGDLGMLDPFSVNVGDPCTFSLADFNFGSIDIESRDLYES